MLEYNKKNCELIVKINKKFYKVNLSSGQTNYVLVRTHLINQKVKMHR